MPTWTTFGSAIARFASGVAPSITGLIQLISVYSRHLRTCRCTPSIHAPRKTTSAQPAAFNHSEGRGPTLRFGPSTFGVLTAMISTQFRYGECMAAGSPERDNLAIGSIHSLLRAPSCILPGFFVLRKPFLAWFEHETSTVGTPRQTPDSASGHCFRTRPERNFGGELQFLLTS